MEGQSADRTTMDIWPTAREHKHLLSQRPATHALSGCDIVAQCFEVGKSTAINVLKNGLEIHKLRALSADIGNIIEESTVFMAPCYGATRRYIKCQNEHTRRADDGEN